MKLRSPLGPYVLDVTSGRHRPPPSDLEDIRAFVRAAYPGADEALIEGLLGGELLLWARPRGGGRIMYFASVALYSVTTGPTGRATIMEPLLMLAEEALQHNGLPQVVGGLGYLAALRRGPLRPIYVFGLCETAASYLMGFRTIRGYPRHDAPTPVDVAAIISACGRRSGPQRWDDAAGVLRGRAPIVPERAAIPDRLLDSPHVRFFMRANPGFARGDCLGVAAPASARNLAGLVVRGLRLRLGRIRRRRARGRD